MVLHLNKLESPLPKDALCQFGWNWLSGSGEEDENMKILWQQQQGPRRQWRGTTDEFDQESSLEPSAQVS